MPAEVVWGQVASVDHLLDPVDGERPLLFSLSGRINLHSKIDFEIPHSYSERNDLAGSSRAASQAGASDAKAQEINAPSEMAITSLAVMTAGKYFDAKHFSDG